MLDKLFKRSENPKGATEKKNFLPNDYYGRFKLEDIDTEIDLITLNRRHAEVRLDFDNNRATYNDTGESRTRKHMNFCKFMLSRIEQRIAEIKKIQDLSRNIIKYKRASPDKWKLMVSMIIERYPGVDLQHIEEIIDNAD